MCVARVYTSATFALASGRGFHFVTSVKFSAMTFNMQFGQTWDPADPDRAAIDLDETIAFLAESDADIFFLQEVERALPGGEQIQPPPNYERLRAGLHGYHSVFAYPRINPDELPFGLALAIFSKTPLTDFVAIDLPPAPVPFEFEGRRVSPSWRQLIGVTTQISGRAIRLFNTHLQAFFMINSSSDEHREQREIVERAVAEDGMPTLLAGDFNCAPNEGLVAQFAAAGLRTAQDVEPTWRRRPYVMDHLFFNAGLKAEHVDVLPTLCSDHHAVKGSFRIAARN